MAISQRMVGNNVGDALPLISGGGVAAGAVAGLREFADVQGGQAFSLIGEPDTVWGRVTRPSVAYGLGAGTLTGLLFALDAGGDALQDFYLAHTAVALPAGAISAGLPKQGLGGPGFGGGEPQRPRNVRSTRSTTSNGAGEFSPSGGMSAETSPAQ